MKVYLLVYDYSCGTETEILRFLDEQPEILNWQTVLPASVFIVTKKNIVSMGKIFRKHFSGCTFILTLIDTTQTEGLLDFGDWEFINNPQPLDE